MLKLYIKGRILYYKEALLICGKENDVKVKGLKGAIPPSQYGLCITGNIYDKDIVEFRTPEGNYSEGVVVRNYRGITSVIECPKENKRYGLRQVAESVRTIGTALDPECDEAYRRYRTTYVPIEAATFNIKVGSKRIKHTIDEKFMIDLATKHVLLNISMSDLGYENKKIIPITFKPHECGLKYGSYFVGDLVRFKKDDNDCIGEIVADDFGCFLKHNESKINLINNNCTVVGSIFSDEDKKTYAIPDSKELEYEVYTDGSAITNPGPCGYGYLIAKEKDIVRKGSKHLGNGTNNIAELTAIRDALIDAAKDTPKKIVLFSDSKYCIDGINKWSRLWTRNGFKASGGTQIANVELWQELLEIITTIRKKTVLQFNWVKGHEDNKFNNECDIMAKKAASLMLKSDTNIA